MTERERLNKTQNMKNTSIKILNFIDNLLKEMVGNNND